MAKKAIIDVDVNSEQFQKFSDLFEKYQSALASTPKSWRDTEKETKSAFQQFEKAAQKAVDISDATDQIRKRQGTLALAAGGLDRVFSSLAKNTGTLAKNITTTTVQLLKWGALTGVFSGLLGAGGLFGIDRLASSVSSQRRVAGGLGTTTAGQQAFAINYGRYVDADSYLSNISNAMHDQTKLPWLMSLGVNGEDLKTKDSAQIGAQILPKILQQFQRGGQTQQGMEAFGLNNFVSLQDAMRLQQAGPGGLAESEAGFRKDRGALSVDSDVQRKWQNLSIQLDRAGTKIENTFVRGLAPLAPELERLSEAFTEAVESFLADPRLKDWIRDLSTGIEHFATYLTSAKFESDIKKFTDGIGAAATAIYDAMKWLGFIKRDPDEPPGPFDMSKEAIEYRLNHKPKNMDWSKFIENTGNEIEYAGKWIKDTFNPDIMQPGRLFGGPLKGPQADNMQVKEPQPFLAGLEQKYKLPAGVLDSIWAAESSRGKNMRSAAGAEGHFQFMPATAKDYGLDDPYDFEKSAEAAAKYMRNLLKMFKGDLPKALAGYNWGQGNVQKLGLSEAPKETRDYINKIRAGMERGRENRVMIASSDNSLMNMGPRANGAPSRVVVEIRNNTGGSAIVATNQVAQ